MRYTLSRNLMFSKTWQIQSNLRSILSSAPACLKVIVTVRDVKPRLVEEADSLGIKVVRSVRGRSSWKVKLAQPQVLGGGEVRGSAQAGGGSASSRHHRNHLLLKVSPLLLLIFNLLSHRLAAFGDTLLGKPKGVMLSHLNIVSATLACTHQLGQYAPNSQVGRHSPMFCLWHSSKNLKICLPILLKHSHLASGHPLLIPPPGAHTWTLLRALRLHGRRCRWLLLYIFFSILLVAVNFYYFFLLFLLGAVGFYSGNLKTLTADMKALKPTILPAVPRFQDPLSFHFCQCPHIFCHPCCEKPTQLSPGFSTGCMTAASTQQTRAVFSGKRKINKNSR